jgi:putative ABC transport system permease protein
MFTNYIKIALRYFSRNKSITSIKIIGLALGLAVTFFILIYISAETSYNDYNTKKDRIFVINRYDGIGGWKSRETCFPMREALINDFPEIECVTRVSKLKNILVLKDEQEIKEKEFICVDKSFFDIFTLNKLEGEFNTFSENDNQLVITESTARKYFGRTDVVNESLKIKIANTEYSHNIVAVINDFPKTTTIKADFISTIEFGLQQVSTAVMWNDGIDRSPDFFRTNWESDFLETYILFKDKTLAHNFDKKLQVMESKYLKDTTQQEYYIQNLKDIYLHSTDMLDKDELGDISSILLFGGIALLVLLIACINYIILSVTQIINRTKEIGIRKILGAKQGDLFRQIIIESLIIVVITVPIAFVLIEQFRPAMEEVIKKQFIITYNWKFLLGLISIISFVVFVPGLNIIYYLNRISPISIFRKDKPISKKRFNSRKILIVLQFIIFIVLIVLTIGIKRQINYSIKSDLGFNPENKVVVQVSDLVKTGKYEAFKNEILKNPDVVNVSAAMWLPPTTGRMIMDYSDSSLTESIKMEVLFVDHDFIETFDLELLEGNSLKDFKDSKGLKVVGNEQAKKLMGADIIGRKFWDGDIIGIVKDFRFHSVHENVNPMVLIAGGPMIREMVIDLQSEINEKVLLKLKKDIKSAFPEFNSEFEILTQRFDFLYNKEKQQAKLIGIYSFLAIFIAAIGLLGLTISTTQKQTKSIAIRKVNGATTISIWKLLISSYVNLIMIAFIVAVPISYYFLDKWLNNFAYKSNIAWWIFIVAGILAIFISLLTVSWYSIRAARQNPVNSLRCE